MSRYRTIVADPPWDHSDGTGYVVTVGDKNSRRQRDDGGYTTTLPYGTMALDAIKALPVTEWAEKDAHLYLWTTNRYLRDVWDVAEAWGFKGVCIIVWCKRPAGVMMGGAWGSNVEFCLFARRGNLPATGKANGRWYEWPRRIGHPGVRQRLDRLENVVVEAEVQRDMAEAYVTTLRGAVLFALGRGKFRAADEAAIKAALNDGTPISSPSSRKQPRA